MHHAKRRFGEGFCIYNDVAFAVQYLIETHQLQRVLVLDTDAHAGNGTAEYFRSNPQVLFIDIHQDPKTIYPGTGFVNDIGADSAKGHSVNIPMPVLAGNASYMAAFEEVILPLTREFQPQIIIRNGGSDPHCADGLTYLGMTVAGFRVVGDKVREMAEVCGGRQIDLIASGYNATILPYAWLSLISGIADFPIEIEEPEIDSASSSNRTPSWTLRTRYWKRSRIVTVTIGSVFSEIPGHHFRPGWHFTGYPGRFAGSCQPWSGPSGVSHSSTGGVQVFYLGPVEKYWLLCLSRKTTAILL